ncbi:PIN domain-containing protein [Paenibacillus oryzisoli]|uniref:PIN-like domain-containing protein n=1 Tax=Paenibacillus oryzisoli TaxID=1850517 RepID=UPI003D291730
MKTEKIESYFKPSVEREKNMWQDCVFVFDTSALLEFYYFSKKSQQEIFDSTFKKLLGRLWIPNHVEFEYLKNRESTLKKPIEEKYKKLESDQIKTIENNIKDIKSRIADFINHTKKEDTHPYIDNTIPLDFDDSCKKFESLFFDFKSKVESEFKKREDEINAFAEQDDVLESFNKYFEVGKEYSYTKLLEIVNEGEIRYRNQIPPGYKDGTKKEGIQKYGDLIIWKQIIDYANQKGKAIVFITNDVKEDWCYQYKRGSETRIDRPKEDLIKEINDIARVDFWMYTFSQFLYSAKEILGTNLTQEVIDEAKTTKSSSKSARVRYDGYYRTLTDDFNNDVDDISHYEYYYYFYDDGRVETKDGKSDEITTGHYRLNGDQIEIKISYPKADVLMIGSVNEEFIKLSWSNDEHSGTERGFFYPVS